jgi:hypothetical protein
MFVGRIYTDSHGAVAGPTLAVFGRRLVMVWPTTDGSIFYAAGMDTSGRIDARPLPGDFSRERLALAPQANGLHLSYSGTDLQTWIAVAGDGENFDWRTPWLETCVGGPATFGPGEDSGGPIEVAYTAQHDLGVRLFRTQNPPGGYPLDGPPQLETSIDTPAVGASGGRLLVAWAGTNAPAYNLNVMRFGGFSTFEGKRTFDDFCYGGPNFATVPGVGLTACYVGHDRHLYFLAGVEELDPARAVRWKFHDTAEHPPAVAAINGITYVAWIATDGASTLCFADLSSMPREY